MPQQRMRAGMAIALILVAAATLNVAAGASESEFNLTYDKPATKWTEALPVGNGRIGAMVFGGTEDERLQINESTLWGGNPHNYANPSAYTHLEEIRQLIFAGKVEEAEKLSESVMGQPKLLMPYQPFCDLRLHFPGHGAQATEYRRELHLEEAIAEVAYKAGSVRFRREVFVSYPGPRSGSSNYRQSTRPTDVQRRDRFSPGWNTRREHFQRYLATHWSNPTAKESAILLDELLGSARHALRRNVEGIGRGRFGSRCW